MIAELALGFVKDDGTIYDLGCSTGTTLLMLAAKLKGRRVRLIGIDFSRAMLERAKAKFEEASFPDAVTWKQCDLNSDCEFQSTDVFIMNLTLQFIRPIYRERLIANIYNSLKPGGCLILVEKVLADNSLLARRYIEQYHDFKKRMGYSELEIAQKREALENILVPYRISENLTLLRQNGFTETDIFFRWYNFAGFIAIK